MKQEIFEERIQYIAFLHKQNLNGRETEDKLFEAGILAGIEETEEQMFDVMQQYAAFCVKCDREKLPLLFAKEWFEKFKK